jgi:cystathionine beta-lyase
MDSRKRRGYLFRINYLSRTWLVAYVSKNELLKIPQGEKMPIDFDEIIPRRATDSLKWNQYAADVLPLWVADMDFRSPEPVIRALRERVEHGIFGYPCIPNAPDQLPEVLVERMFRLYGWLIKPEDLLFIPGVVTGLNLVCQALAQPGGGVLIQTPVYHPFLRLAKNVGMVSQEMELTLTIDEHYLITPEIFQAAVTDQTRVFVLCNPHNPVGRVFTEDELVQMAEVCLQRGVVICSDEIHCDLLYSGQKHIPIASLDPEIAQNTITLMAPSKTFNIAGMQCALAIVQNPKLREILSNTSHGLTPSVNLMGLTAGLAAYREGQEWLDQLLRYLEGNRDFLVDYVSENLPGIKLARPEGTYLAWLDCRQAGIQGSPGDFFLKQARVGLNEGSTFGKGGEGFVRLNFGCPRDTLVEALERMRYALISNI